MELDLETFGIFHRKSGPNLKKPNKYRKGRIKEVKDYVEEEHTRYA